MSIAKAKKAFSENADRRFLSAETDPAAWNTNAGLLNLCHAVEQMQRELQAIKASVAHVSKQVAQVALRQ